MKSLFLDIKKLWKHFNYQIKVNLVILMALIILSLVLEMATLAGIIPYMAMLINPLDAIKTPIIDKIIYFLPSLKKENLLIFITILYSTFLLLSGGIRIFIQWFFVNLSFKIGSELGSKIYENVLHDQYDIHKNRNTSEVINVITSKVNVVIYHILNPVFIALSSFVITIGIVAVLIFLSPFIAIFIISIFILIYLGINKFTGKKVLAGSENVSDKSTHVIKIIQEGLRGIKDVIMNSSQNFYLQEFKKIDVNLRNAQAYNFFIATAPRFFVESVGLFLIVIFAFIIKAYSANNLLEFMPLLAVLGISAQKILPLLHQIYNSWSNIQAGQPSLKDVLSFLDHKITIIGKNIKIPFKRKIEFKNITFNYKDSSFTLSDVNIVINKGDRIGLIGKSGSGKSTFLDIFCGLLEPKTGTIKIDSIKLHNKNIKSFRDKIALVSQSIFLIDSTVEENIAFGIPPHEIDQALLEAVCSQAQILDKINSLPHRFKTSVGENGVKLSGGQVQRIGIARALYKKSEIIIFDEATSALDKETEKDLMEAIELLNPELTIIMVAHRLSTLNSCNKIIEFVNGKVRFVKKI